MSESPAPDRSTAGGNPFSTRHVRPGALAYLFPDGMNAEQLVQRLRANGWRGEIVGPHGSGKSTLLANLLPVLELAGRNVVPVTLHEGERRWPKGNVAESKTWNSATQVVVDGYEQLGWWSRRWLTFTCRARGAGLLVTAHRSVGLPPLLETASSLELLQTLVALLLPAGETLVSLADIAVVHSRHGNNVREALFALYDLYELRMRSLHG